MAYPLPITDLTRDLYSIQSVTSSYLFYLGKWSWETKRPMQQNPKLVARGKYGLSQAIDHITLHLGFLRLYRLPVKTPLPSISPAKLPFPEERRFFQVAGIMIVSVTLKNPSFPMKNLYFRSKTAWRSTRVNSVTRILTFFQVKRKLTLLLHDFSKKFIVGLICNVRSNAALVTTVTTSSAATLS